MIDGEKGPPAAAARSTVQLCKVVVPVVLGVPALVALLMDTQRHAADSAVPPAAPEIAAAQEEAPGEPDWHTEYALASQLSELLDRKIAEVRARSQAKKHLARELAMGRLSLADALIQWHALSYGKPGEMWALRARFPANTQDESICLSLIHRAELEYRNDPDRAAALAARLHAELRRHVRDGTLPQAEGEETGGAALEKATDAIAAGP